MPWTPRVAVRNGFAVEKALVATLAAAAFADDAGSGLWRQVDPPAATAALSTAPPTSTALQAEASEDCTWPACMPRCIPCQNKEVGTCTLAPLGSLFACKAERGPTDCILGKCLCQDLYCASADGESCEPQVCLGGARPPAYQLNRWTGLFAALGSAHRFPPPLALQSVPKEFIWSCIKPGIALVEVGLFIATCTLACICCCRGCGIMHLRLDHRGKLLTHQQLSTGGNSDGESDEAHGLMADDVHDRPTKPWACPMVSVALLLIVGNYLAIKIRHRTFSRDIQVVGGQLLHAYTDLKTVSEEAGVINQTCADFEKDLVRVPLSCKVQEPISRKVLEKFTAMADDAMANYVGQVESLYDSVRGLPKLMRGIARLVEKYSQLVIWVPLLPVLAVSAICILIILEAIAAGCFGSSSVAKCVDCGLKLASLLFFLIIVLIAAIAGVELSVCIAASEFCTDVDANALEYVQWAVGGNETNPYSDAYNATRYYISGDVHNPILGYAESAEKYITQIVRLYKDMKLQLNLVGVMCPAINDINLEDIGDQAEQILGRCREILNGTNVYPYYEGILRKGICGRVIPSIGWVILFQLVAGLGFFPVCVMLTHCYLVRFAAWKHSLDGSDEEAEDEEGSSEEQSGSEDEGLNPTNRSGPPLAKRCTCGNVFKPDATFCRKCGATRMEEGEMPRRKQLARLCKCGNVFAADATFCRKCGARRPEERMARELEAESPKAENQRNPENV